MIQTNRACFENEEKQDGGRRCMLHCGKEKVGANQMDFRCNEKHRKLT